MKYFLDTEFLEGTQKKWFGETKPTIDLISIGIVCGDCREYYAISKDFNLKEAWNKFDLKPNEELSKISPELRQQKLYNFYYNSKLGYEKVYWLRDNVLKPIFIELLHEEYSNEPTFYDKYNNGLRITNDFRDTIFNYKNLKRLLSKYGKTNKQIAEEIKDFISYKQFYKDTYQYNLYQDSFYDLRIEDLKHRNMLPEFYGYYSDYDWVVFCWLFGKMNNLPKGFPMYCKDLKQELDNKLKVTNIESKLWDLLDNIDSASDMFKPDNENKYVQYIYSKLKHHELLKCDGYNIISKYKAVEEIQALPNYPKQTNEHNALSDAKWNFELYKFLNTL